MDPVVGVILGSKSDLPLMESCVEVLDDLGLTHEVKVCSAHRNPRGVMEWATSARSRGLKVVIAAAGGAAHLPGVVAAWTDLPVIGVPVPTQHLQGVDSLYSIVQMPAGVPVATVAIGEAGAKNAAWLAARIIGLQDSEVEQRHGERRAAMATEARGDQDPPADPPLGATLGDGRLRRGDGRSESGLRAT